MWRVWELIIKSSLTGTMATDMLVIFTGTNLVKQPKIWVFETVQFLQAEPEFST